LRASAMIIIIKATDRIRFSTDNECHLAKSMLFTLL
jgi:hypothetical protein